MLALLLSCAAAVAGPTELVRAPVGRVRAEESVYQKDVAVALVEIEKLCGLFFETKKIDWKKVEKDFTAAARDVKTDQDELVLLTRLLARLEDGHAAVQRGPKTKDLAWPKDGPYGVSGELQGCGMFWCRVGKKLYVNKWYYDNKGGTWVFDIKRDGTLTNMRKFSEWGGDGMSMDEWGNVYISNGKGVMGFARNGRHILTIPTGSGATNNTFAGRNRKLLFITGPVDSVTGVRMRVRGASAN